MSLLLVGSAAAATVTIAWDPNPEPDVAGYIVSYGISSGVYGTNVNVGNITSYGVTNLAAEQRYFFVVRAYSSGGAQSLPSVEVTTVTAAQVALVTVSPTTANLKVGETANLTAQAFDASHNPLPSVPLTWSTSNSAVVSLTATIGSTVTITAAGAGNTTVIARAGTVSATAAVTVSPAPSVSRVTITPANANLVPAQTQQFVALAYDSTDTLIAGAAFTWTTTSATVAPLSATTGAAVTVTPQVGGTATLTATATSTGTSAQATVNVAAAHPITHVTMTPGAATPTLGRKQTLVALGLDSANASIPSATFSWTTSNAAVAKLGTTTGGTIAITAYGLGTATITATETGGLSATSTITVVAGDTLVWDTFTGANGTPLSSHPADANLTGSVWRASGSAIPTLQGGFGRVTSSGGASSIVYATIDTASADVRVSADWRAGIANAWGGVALRWTDADNFLFAGYRASNELAVFRVQGGVWTRLVGAPLSVASGTIHQIEAAATGATIQVYWDGGLLLEASDGFNQSTGGHGLVWANGIDTASGYDTFRVSGTPAPPPAPPPPSPPPSSPPSSSPPSSSPPSSSPPSSSPPPSAPSAPAPPSAGPTPVPPAPPAPGPVLQPNTPSNLIATVTGATVVLRWAAPTIYPTASYILEAGSASGLADQASLDTENRLTTFTASPVPPGRYFIRLRAHGIDGATSAASNEVIANVGGGPPACLAVTLPPPTLWFEVDGSTVILNWRIPGGDVTSYAIEAGSFPGAANLLNFDTQSSATSYTAAGVASGTYFVRLRAKNACGAGGNPSNEAVVRVGG